MKHSNQMNDKVKVKETIRYLWTVREKTLNFPNTFLKPRNTLFSFLQNHGSTSLRPSLRSPNSLAIREQEKISPGLAALTLCWEVNNGFLSKYLAIDTDVTV